MAIVDWPTTPDAFKLSYNLIMIVGLVVTAFVWQAYGAWLPFVVMFLFVALFFWDIYVRPAMYPETELSDDNYFDIQFSKWINGNEDKLAKRVAQSEARSKSIEREMEKLKYELEVEKNRGS